MINIPQHTAGEDGPGCARAKSKLSPYHPPTLVMTAGLIDPFRKWPSYDERGNMSRVRLPGRIVRTSERTDDDLVLAHTRNIKREMPRQWAHWQKLRNNRRRCVPTGPAADIRAHRAVLRKGKGSNGLAWSTAARLTRQHSNAHYSDNKNIILFITWILIIPSLTQQKQEYNRNFSIVK